MPHAAPYLTLTTEDTPQRTPSLYDVFNGSRWLVRASTPWRMVPHDLPLTPANVQDRAQVVSWPPKCKRLQTARWSTVFTPMQSWAWGGHSVARHQKGLMYFARQEVRDWFWPALEA
jgi:hypothetical protein